MNTQDPEGRAILEMEFSKKWSALEFVDLVDTIIVRIHLERVRSLLQSWSFAAQTGVKPSEQGISKLPSVNSGSDPNALLA